jgi:kynureninase
MTAYLEALLDTELVGLIKIITPRCLEKRGCQLSIRLHTNTSLDIDNILHQLKSHGVICDVRQPDVLRIAPVPLYNSYADVYDFVKILKQVLTQM